MIERFHGGLKENTIDFSVNLNPFIEEKMIKEFVIKNYLKAIRYPQQRGNSLVELISDKFNIPVDNIILGNGSIEFFYNLPRVLPVHSVYTLEPTFSEYRYVAKINKCKYFPVKPLSEFEWDFDDLLRKLNNKSLLFVCNPNNPTGNIFSKSDILKILRTGAFVVVDEAFMDFSERNESLLQEVIKYKNLIVVKSLTKIYSIAGLRIGFCVASKRVIENLNKVMPLWNVNGIALSVAKEFLLNDDIILMTKKLLKREKEYILKSFESNKYIKIFDSYANFFLAKSNNTQDLISYLSKKDITVRENKGFCGLNKNYFRFAVKKRRENELLIKMINEFFLSGCNQL
ncbi:MAG: histidinol-phosphate aminotransferase family protein [Proteobacteria bacterium]|nr:histidinol-phosphate aminotransferase family protein [Pseudomonadota bacterium]